VRWETRGCVSFIALEELLPHADGPEEDCEEDEDESGGEAEGRSQDEAEVALSSFC